MTRLSVNDIQHIPLALPALDERLVQQTGKDLLGIACHAIGEDPSTIGHALSDFRIAVIPTTCGKGLLGGFSQSLMSIATHLGCRARITRATDVAGLAEAFESEENVILTADDNRYVAIDLHTCAIADNARATGAGFAAALDLMAGGVVEKTAIVMGCGPVGIHAAKRLIRFGARVILVDPDAEKRRAAAAMAGMEAAVELEDESCVSSEILKTGLIVEATNAASTLNLRDLSATTLVSAPGMPLGLVPEAVTALGPRLYHDPLETGTAVMLAMLAARHRADIKSEPPD